MKLGVLAFSLLGCNGVVLVQKSNTQSAEAVQMYPQVVKLLEDMRSELTADTKEVTETAASLKEECDDSIFQRKTDIETATTDLETLLSTFENFKAESQKAKQHLGELKANLDQSNKDLEEYQAEYQKVRDQFSEVETSSEKSLDQIERALEVSGKNSAAAGDQAMMADTLGSDGALLAVQSVMQQAMKQVDEVPAGGSNVVMLLNGLEEETRKSLDEAVTQFKKDKAKWQGLITTAKNSVDTLTQSIAQKESAIQSLETEQGRLSQSLLKRKENIKTLSDSLSETGFSCKEQETELEETLKELIDQGEAVSKAIGILSGLSHPSGQEAAPAEKAGKKATSFLQVESNPNKMAALRQTVSTLSLISPELASLAQQSMQTGDPFAKIAQLINDMIRRLTEQVAQESSKEAFCHTEMEKAQKKFKKVKAELKKQQTRLEFSQAEVGKIEGETKKKTEEMVNLKEQTEKETALRKREFNQNDKIITQSQQNAIAIRNAVTILKAAFGETDFLQVSDGNARQKANSGQKSSSTGDPKQIVTLLVMLQTDAEKLAAETKQAEEKAASSFEDLTQKRKVEIAVLTKGVEMSKLEKTRMETLVMQLGDDLALVKKELTSVEATIANIKEQCTAKTLSPQEVAAKREAVIESLKGALAVLEQSAAA